MPFNTVGSGPSTQEQWPLLTIFSTGFLTKVGGGGQAGRNQLGQKEISNLDRREAWECLYMHVRLVRRWLRQEDCELEAVTLDYRRGQSLVSVCRLSG